PAVRARRCWKRLPRDGSSPGTRVTLPHRPAPRRPGPMALRGGSRGGGTGTPRARGGPRGGGGPGRRERRGTGSGRVRRTDALPAQRAARRGGARSRLGAAGARGRRRRVLGGDGRPIVLR